MVALGIAARLEARRASSAARGQLRALSAVDMPRLGGTQSRLQAVGGRLLVEEDWVQQRLHSMTPRVLLEAHYVQQLHSRPCVGQRLKQKMRSWRLHAMPPRWRQRMRPMTPRVLQGEDRVHSSWMCPPQ